MSEEHGPSRLGEELNKLRDRLSVALGIPPDSREKIYRNIFSDSMA